MFSSLFALVAAVAVKGAVVQRDGTFTFMTPQPTSPTPSTVPCSTSCTPVVVTPTTSTPPCTTSCTPVVVTPTTSVTPCTTSCTPVVVTPPTTSTTPCTTTSSATPCVKCTPSGSIPVTTPTPGGTASCTGVQNWQASFAYTAGNQVIFNNQLFTATQWTFNNAPDTHPDQWAAGGTCAQPINNKANCAGVAAWQSNVAYTTGNQVTFNNHLWSAVQWTQSNAPADTSGSWKDLGACA